MKKVSFGATRPSTVESRGLDAWVTANGADNLEPTKRFTFDVPLSLHTRVKTECAIHNLVMADVMRQLLEEKFPAPSEQEQGTAS